MNHLKSIPSRAHALRLALVGSLAACLMLPLGAAHAASTTADASATVVEPIAITKSADLAFGKFSAGTGGTVVVDTDGNRTVTSGVVLLTGTPGAAATFDVSGDNGATYAITLPTGPATLTGGSGSDEMSVDTWVSAPDATGTLTSGTETVKVGATLTVGSAQAPGVYNGSFSVAVEYN